MSVVIVGAGEAGIWVARTLRQEGYTGAIDLIGDEPHAPYERPPLSKAFLADVASDPAPPIAAEKLAGLAIRFSPSTRIVAIDRARRVALAEDGRSFGYDKLVLAQGGRVRRLRLAGEEPEGVSYLRTRDDALALRSGLASARTVLVIGGGWIGLEVAASARARGCRVIVAEVAERLCGRSLPAEAAALLHDLHSSRGVEIRLGTPVLGIVPAEGRFRVSFGEDEVTVDLAVAGIGLEPAVDLATASGLEISDGVVVDSNGRTSDPDIYAAGDMCNRWSSFLGRHLRHESWENAQRGGAGVARALLGKPTGIPEVPWFWSDQYDATMQVVGAPLRWGEAVRRESANGGVTLFYLQNDRIEAAVGLNVAREIRTARRLIERGTVVDPRRLADADVPLPTP